MTTPARRADTDVAAVVVNYNYARFVGQAIESVLHQDVPFAEVVVVDDGSTDDSVRVIRTYQPRVRVVSKPNGGQLSACLAGLLATTSPYVYFLDADDIADAGLVRVAAPYLSGDPAKVQFPLTAVDADGEPTGSVFPTVPAGYDAAQMREDNCTLGFYMCPPTSGNIYSRAALQLLTLAPLDHRDFIDGPVTLALPYMGEIVALNTPLARYRIHGGNHSQWYEPTPELLQREVDWFVQRWRQTCAALGWQAPPFGDETPAYVRERMLMLAALDGRAEVADEARGFVRRVAPANIPAAQRLLLMLWATALVVPLPGLRRRLVAARRSPAARPAALRRVVQLVRYITARA